jgi:hypothetical protein
MAISETAGAASRPVLAGRSGAAVAALTLCCVLPACGRDAPQDAAPAAPAAGVRPAVVTTGITVPRSPGAQAARRVCGASSPGRIRRQFLPRATAHASRAERAFIHTAAAPSPALRASKSYAYLAARVYAMSVTKSDRAGAYAGCAYELSEKESGR